MSDRQGLTVHVQYEQCVRIACHGERQAALHFWEIASLADNVDGIGVNPGKIEHHVEWSAFPDRVAGSIVAHGVPSGTGSKRVRPFPAHSRKAVNFRCGILRKSSSRR